MYLYAWFLPWNPWWRSGTPVTAPLQQSHITDLAGFEQFWSIASPESLWGVSEDEWVSLSEAWRHLHTWPPTQSGETQKCRSRDMGEDNSCCSVTSGPDSRCIPQLSFFTSREVTHALTLDFAFCTRKPPSQRKWWRGGTKLDNRCRLATLALALGSLKRGDVCVHIRAKGTCLRENETRPPCFLLSPAKGEVHREAAVLFRELCDLKYLSKVWTLTLTIHQCPTFPSTQREVCFTTTKFIMEKIWLC